VHPAAEFPRGTPEELRALGEDIIERNELTSPIVLWKPDEKTPAVLLDGCNRLDALEVTTGFRVEIGVENGQWFIDAGSWISDKVIVLDGSVDPYAYVVSANIHRRHLKPKQKRDQIAKLIKAQPEKPDLQIAKTVKVSPTTVGTVRREMEAKGDVSKLETRTDTQGRKQPAKRTRSTTYANIRRMKLGDDTVDALAGTSLDNAREQDALIFLNRGAPEGEHTPIVKCLIADAEAGKAVSALQFKNGSIQDCDLKVAHEQNKDDLAEQLQAAKIKIAGLENEIADLKAAAESAPKSKSGFRCSICHENKPVVLRPVFICDGCVNIYDVREAAPLPDDGLDFPKNLLRQPEEAIT
jgi:hypothetical protein